MQFFPFFALLFSFSLPAQSYHFQTYSVGEGLPQSQVYAISPDTFGYLWLGTQGGGVARFDGKNFVHHTEQNGLSGNFVQTLSKGPDNRVWAGTNRGVNRYDGNRFQPVGSREIRDVQDLAFDPTGRAWAATLHGIFFLEENRDWEPAQMGIPPGALWYAALQDSQGRLWMAGEKGIFQYTAGQTEWKKSWSDNAEVLALAEDADGLIWAAVFNYGLLYFDKGRWQKFSAPNLKSKKLQCLWAAPNGQIWAGTQDAGLFFLEKESGSDFGKTTTSAKTLNTSDGLCNNHVKSIGGDKWGNVWAGTSGGGVCRFGGQEFLHITRQDGLKSDFVYALESDTAGGLWLSAGDRGISHFYQNRFAHFGKETGFFDLKCRALHRDAQGNLWIGTDGAGLALLRRDDGREQRFLRLDRQDGLAGNWVRDIASISENEVWVATTDGGISRVAFPHPDGPFSFVNFGPAEGLPDKRVHALHFDKKGRLWFATQRAGIGIITDGSLKMLDASAQLANTTIRSLVEDSTGHLWCATEDRGIGRATIYGDSTPVFKFFSQADGLTSANIYLLQFDREGRLWAGSNRGMDRLSLDASRNITEVRHFGRGEGFRGVETCQNAALMDGAGSLWFGTINGLMHYQPSPDTGSVVKPVVHFTGVRLFYEPLANTNLGVCFDPGFGIKPGTTFPHNQNHLGFEFFAPNLPSPDNTFYSWQLVGLEENWSPFSRRSEVSYANLPPGSYTFRVRAKNEKEITGDVLETRFFIKPPFWATWWFRLLSVLSVLIVVGALFFVRIGQVRNRAAQEKARLEMQNHLLQLEQKARQLQMNPHFIFNALNSIQTLVAGKDYDGSRAYILKFGKLMRAVLDNSRQALIPLEKEMDTLEKYLEMEQFCREGKFDFSIRADGVKNVEMPIPPMLLQPFVENAILHGVAPLKDKKGFIEIVFREETRFLRVEIKDNGVGIRPAQSPGVPPPSMLSGQAAKRSSSAGILVTKERLDILKGNLDITSTPETGTTVVVHIPI